MEDELEASHCSLTKKKQEHKLMQTSGTEKNGTLLVSDAKFEDHFELREAAVQGKKLNTLENMATTTRCEKARVVLNNFSLIIHGRSFQCIKQSNGIVTSEWKPNVLSAKDGAKENDTLPVLSGPRFRPWSRGKQESRKHGDDACRLQEHQRKRNEYVNLLKMVDREANETAKANSNQEFICLSTPFKVLPGSAKQGSGLVQQNTTLECAETEQTCQSITNIPPVRKEEILNVKLLRRKLISFYDHGNVIPPFEAIVGEALNHKSSQSKVESTNAFQQEIFPFAVPYLRLPLLPSSRQNLERISQLIAKRELLPWQLQHMTLEQSRQQSGTELTDDVRKEKETGKTSLQVIIPTTS